MSIGQEINVRVYACKRARARERAHTCIAHCALLDCAAGIKNPIAAATALLYKGREGLMPLGRVPPLVLTCFLCSRARFPPHTNTRACACARVHVLCMLTCVRAYATQMLAGEGARQWCEQEGLEVAAKGDSEMHVRYVCSWCMRASIRRMCFPLLQASVCGICMLA